MNRRTFILITTLLLVGLAGGVFYYRDVLFSDESLLQFGNIKKDILTSGPLRALYNSPNAYLTHEGTIDLTNDERVKAGLQPLRENAELNAAAKRKLEDMFAKHYFEHVSPDGEGPSDVADKAGYRYIVIGENLALGNFADDKALVEAWMNSPGHRANILHADYQEIGVAVARGIFEGAETWIAVQEFGKPQSACPTIDDTLRTRIEMNRALLDSREDELASMKADLEESHPRTPAEREEYNRKVERYNAAARAYSAQSSALGKDIKEYNRQVQAFNACIES